MGDASESSGRLGDGSVIELIGKIMVVAIIILLFIVVFVFCVHLYVKYVWYSRQEEAADGTTRRRRRRRRRLDFAAGQDSTVVLRQGLDPSVLNSVPVVLFDPKEFKDGLECAVCLSELAVGEKARLLPKCSHGFHVECIDMWFHSHSTCPVCRNPVANGADIPHAPVGEGSPAEAPSIPTNMLFWGDETQVSTCGPCVEEAPQGSVAGESSSSSSSATTSVINRPNGALVIDIPRQDNDEDDQKSPIRTKLRALKRLLSGKSRVNPSSPRDSDLEQGTQGQN